MEKTGPMACTNTVPADSPLSALRRRTSGSIRSSIRPLTSVPRPQFRFGPRKRLPTCLLRRLRRPAQLGLTFISSVSGYVTGLRYYKSSTNTGQHLGYLWSSTGNLLASVTFTNESASGWQQANFPTPIAINANIPYIVSYWSARGHYADDAGYFATSGVTNQMLYAPPDGQYGPNGSYATSNVFPSGSSSLEQLLG